MGGDRLKRRKLEAYEEYISKTFLDGERIAITPRSDLDRVVSIEIADKFENEIYNIGDGIHHILLMTFPLICKFTGGCVFIEEPELYLHPGLLRQLIQTLLSDARYSKYQFFISTHSNHLVDKAIENENIATFKLSKTTAGDTQKFQIERSSGSDLGILADLGVNASSVFLSNCTIWVEGITDRLYIAHMMKLLLQEKNETFLEGIHYAFVEYGGANITHWSFGESEAELNQPIDRIDALSISSKILLISDNNESPIGALKSRRESLERQLGDRYINLECKEIENLISWSVLKSVLVADGENVSSEFQYDQYKCVYLGGFIHEQILPGPRNKVWMEGDSGSANPIKGKVDFCKKSIAAMKVPSDLSEYAKIVCLRIIDFVRSCNRH